MMKIRNKMWKWERDTSSACYSFHYRIVKMNAGVWVVTMEVSLNCFCPFKFNSNLITYYIYIHACLLMSLCNVSIIIIISIIYSIIQFTNLPSCEMMLFLPFDLWLRVCMLAFVLQSECHLTIQNAQHIHCWNDNE